MVAPYPGHCLCGAVQYRVTAEPVTVYACHCTDCQHLSGSAFALAMVVPLASIEVRTGEPSSYFAELSGGRVRQGRLCRACGSRLWGVSQRRPDMAVVQVGTLENTSWVRPAAHVWAKSAQPWFIFPPDVPVYQTQPEDPAALVHHWRNAQGQGGA
jgi:hypothetical protein